MKYTFFILFNFYSLALLCQSEVRVDLKKLITDYEGFESYNKNDFPLGDFSETRFKKEYEFFNEIQNKLSSISLKDLSENDKISYGLLMFIINDKINSYEFNSRYNPILSDSGFHNSIIYNVRALTGEKDAIRYLELLKAIPLYVEQNIYLIQGLTTSILNNFILSIGAGLYEELIFRFFLLFILAKSFSFVFKTKELTSLILSIIVSSVLFSAFHYIGAESFTPLSFIS